MPEQTLGRELAELNEISSAGDLARIELDIAASLAGPVAALLDVIRTAGAARSAADLMTLCRRLSDLESAAGTAYDLVSRAVEHAQDRESAQYNSRRLVLTEPRLPAPDPVLDPGRTVAAMRNTLPPDLTDRALTGDWHDWK